ncbi:MAG TPA: hypothetical protein VH062_09860 [Polyangiaceae bacterium]|jgi:hypothetical protein|nr:hypothetical protein [Polyangiaceae bacterium]
MAYLLINRSDALSILRNNDTLAEAVKWWDSRGHEVDAAIALLESALASLGKRTGERADNARDYLQRLHDRWTKGREAAASFGDFNGPVAKALTERLFNSKNATTLARMALENAPVDRDAVANARVDYDVAVATLHAFDRDVGALCAALAWDSTALPSAALFSRARGDTEHLAQIANSKRSPMRAQEAALHQGGAVDRARGAGAAQAIVDAELEARLWVCWETGAPEFQARWRRYEETCEPASAAVAAE